MDSEKANMQVFQKLDRENIADSVKRIMRTILMDRTVLMGESKKHQVEGRQGKPLWREAQQNAVGKTLEQVSI